MAGLRGLLQRGFEPVSGASLAVFRIAFGAILLWETVRFFLGGWIAEFYLEPSFHFTYWGFSWVRPWPGIGLYLHFAGLALAALGIMLGLYQRWCSAAFLFGFGYVFLLEKARYLNHFYLVILLTFLLVVVPANRVLSIDAWRRGRREGAAVRGKPATQGRIADVGTLPEGCAPAWCVFLLRAQVGLVYFFAGVAKLNADWLRGRPLDEWLAQSAQAHLLGPVLAHPWAPYLFSYGGLLLDLCAAPLLLWRRTRVLCFLFTLAFHLTNSSMFGIGIFPWTMIAATTLFFVPDWPLRWWTKHPWNRAIPALPPRRAQWPVVAFLSGYLLVQLLVPLRHFLYPGNVSWTEEGHAFSWHMKLRDKESQFNIIVYDPVTQQTFLVDPRVDLKPWQMDKGGGRPDMILEYAQHVAQSFRAAGQEQVEVRAAAAVSLNGHPKAWLIDSSVDLSRERKGLHRYSWVYPSRHTHPVAADFDSMGRPPAARTIEPEW